MFMMPVGFSVEERLTRNQSPTDGTAAARLPSGSSPKDLIRQINLLLRGWVECFLCPTCSKAMGEVNAHTEQRLRIWLRNRRKVRSWKDYCQRFPLASQIAVAIQG